MAEENRRSAFMYRHIMQVKDLGPGETEEDHMQEVIAKYKAIDAGTYNQPGTVQGAKLVLDEPLEEEVDDVAAPLTLEEMTAKELVAYAAKLNPPLALKPIGVKKADMIAEIELHEEAHASD